MDKGHRQTFFQRRDTGPHTHEKMLTSLTTAETQIATTVRHHFASARTAVGSQNTAGAGRGAEGSDLTGAEAAVCTGRPGRAPLGGVWLGPLAPPGADAALTGACSSALASAFFMEPPSRGMRSIFPVWAKSKWVPGGRGITAGGTEGPW